MSSSTCIKPDDDAASSVAADTRMMQQAQPKSAATRADAATVRSSSWPTQHGWNTALYQFAKIDWKALSHRIGHSDVAFTMKHQTDLEADRRVADTLAELIIGGSLAPTSRGEEDDGPHLGETA
jgi:hypothetical protein